MEIERGHLSILNLPIEVQDVVLAAKRPSTRKSYGLKWKRFSILCNSKGLDPGSCPIPMILKYLTSLYKSGLKMQSIKVHL